MKIKFLIAEEIRPEADGKLTILGLFPDDNILIVKGDQPEGVPADIPGGLERLAFLVSVSDLPEGVHKFTGRIIDPSGVLYKSEMPLGEGVVEKGTSRSLIVETKPFIFSTKGTYHFEFLVDKDVSSFPFEIRDRPE